MSYNDEDRSLVDDERVTNFRSHGYRGFNIGSLKSVFEELEITVKNAEGKILSARADTEEQAIKKIIDLIDQQFDES